MSDNSTTPYGNPTEHARHIIDFYFEPKNEWARSRIARVMAAVALKPGERVLDLGCANATFSFHAFRAGTRPVGIDRDGEVLRRGRQIARDFAGIATPRTQGDATRLPFREGVFDVVINADFVEHLPAECKEPVYREMFRVMKRGGRGIVYTPNRTRVVLELAGEKIKKAFGFRKEDVPRWQDYVDPDHFGMVDPFETVALLKKAGFATQTEYFEFHMPLLSKIPGANTLLKPFAAPYFSNRILVKVAKE